MTDFNQATVRFLMASAEIGKALRYLEKTLSGHQAARAKELHHMLENCCVVADEMMSLPDGTTLAFGGGGEKG